jgi:hypothetical protein
MKASMDDEVLAYQMRKADESKASLTQWLLIISLGVFLGNAASFGLERAVLYWDLKQVALATTAAIEESTRKRAIQSAEQKKIRDAQAKQRQIQTQKKQAGLRQATETCNFWKQQLAKENTSQNRMHREQACKLVSSFR